MWFYWIQWQEDAANKVKDSWLIPWVIFTIIFASIPMASSILVWFI